MPNRVRFALSCLLLLVAAALCGCHNAPPSPPAQLTPVPVAPPPHETTAVPAAPTGKASTMDMMAAVMTLTNSAPFPKGTQLISVNVEGSVVTLNFSKEFSALANAGDSVESQAQKSLRAALAKFPDIQKMRVTVEGKPFDSQNTDWNTPFAVRDEAPKPGGEGQGGGQ